MAGAKAAQYHSQLKAAKWDAEVDVSVIGSITLRNGLVAYGVVRDRTHH